MATSSDWSNGYQARAAYYDTVQPNAAPVMMDLSLTVAGIRPPRNGDRFRYVEFGCGSAYNLVLLAALHPEAEFLGVDFMPEHVASARVLIEEAGLVNITVREASFGELLDFPDPEPFDYAALHGVWTWLAPEVQKELVEVLGRWLKPGGIAYFGYAAAAGWAAPEPIRHLFRTIPTLSGAAGYSSARNAVAHWIEAVEPPGVSTMWDLLSSMPDLYLAHDLGAEHGRPVWLSDLQSELAPAKMIFAAPCDLAEQFDMLRFRDKALAFVTEAAKAGWGETARDLASTRSFRADLFSRGAPRLSGAERTRRIRAMTIALWEPMLDDERDVSETRKAFSLASNITREVTETLSSGPMTIEAFVASCKLEDRKALQAALLCVALEQVRVIVPARAEVDQAVARLHGVLRARLRDGSQLPGIASPRLGCPICLKPSDASAFAEPDKAGEDHKAGFARLGV
ncbi:class I SAM-dependent methyltransferase [Ruegeria marina]|uniref:Methyltransferase domain-containing protein n=1 Tax=Ruegeria marina TaxID=639004 RepID=A0A1G6R0S9_9RHOB|nr:class I SAM-dependent methyltransferase [Ruegeria marina]SDC97516.1 Methyltransferase domain-containing protein [Ruegeria marina]